MKTRRRKAKYLMASAAALSALVATTGDAVAASPSNSAAPEISGTAKFGQTLTASQGTWSGPGTLEFSYQWQRCDDPNTTCANITDATATTYKLGSDDIGKYIKVVVGASDTLVVSAASAIVADYVKPGNTELPGRPAGTPKVGQTLTADDGKWTGDAPISYAYKWKRCAGDGTGCTDIAAATSKTYKAVSVDEARTLRVEVTASNSASAKDSATSLQTEAIAPIAPVARTADPTITGTVEVGQTLTAGDGTWTGDAPIAYSYKWQRCDAADLVGTTCTDIATATAATYVLADADLGKRMRIAVTADNEANAPVSAGSTVSALVAPAPPTVTSHPHETTLADTAKFEFTGTAPFECKVDSGEWASCVSAYEMPEVDIGSHTFSVRSGSEGTPATSSWNRVEPDLNAIKVKGSKPYVEVPCALPDSSPVATCEVNLYVSRATVLKKKLPYSVARVASGSAQTLIGTGRSTVSASEAAAGATELTVRVPFNRAGRVLLHSWVGNFDTAVKIHLVEPDGSVQDSTATENFHLPRLIIAPTDGMFDFDKAVLTKKGSRWVKAVARALPTSAMRAIHCQGNTDSIGSAKYNYTLGMRRADAVCKAFKRRIKARFHSSSAGEYKARATNSTDRGRARNRRVVLGLFYR